MKTIKWIFIALMTLFVGCDDGEDLGYEIPKLSVKDMVSLMDNDYDSVMAKYPYALIEDNDLYIKILYAKTNNEFNCGLEFINNKLDEFYMWKEDKVILLEDLHAVAAEIGEFAAIKGEIWVTYEPIGGSSDGKQFNTYQSFKEWSETITNKLEIRSVRISWGYGFQNVKPINIDYRLHKEDDGSIEDCSFELCIGEEKYT